jgi:hypothetical protein
VSVLKVTDIQHPSAVDPAIELDAAGKLWLAGGKILQVVRATDSTQRSTTSTSFVDVTGMSVTITPQKEDSAIMIIASFESDSFGNVDDIRPDFTITDSSNNAISGSEGQGYKSFNYTGAGLREIGTPVLMIAYATPATTSATTYKLRFLARTSTTVRVRNNVNTGQMYAIEVSA